jgi:hypothetical protein
MVKLSPFSTTTMVYWRWKRLSKNDDESVISNITLYFTRQDMLYLSATTLQLAACYKYLLLYSPIILLMNNRLFWRCKLYLISLRPRLCTAWVLSRLSETLLSFSTLVLFNIVIP